MELLYVKRTKTYGNGPPLPTPQLAKMSFFSMSPCALFQLPNQRSNMKEGRDNNLVLKLYAITS